MTDISQSLDQQIVSAAGGDRAALEALLLHFHDPLLLHLRATVTENGAAGITPEDVLQETLTEVCRSIRNVEPRGQEAFFSWLKTVARTRLINLINAHKALKRGGGRPPARQFSNADATATSILNLLASRDPTASRITQRKEAIAAIGKALARLDPAKRQIIEQRYGQGVSIEEIARQTGKSASAVKMIINRAIKELRDAVTILGEFTAGL